MKGQLDLTSEERRAIKGAIRRAFRQSLRMRNVLQKARIELPPALKKDGTPGARNQVRYKCAGCNDLFPQKFIQVDHKNPAVPLGVKEDNLTPTELVLGIFCSIENLQVLCSTPARFLSKGEKSCHSKKTTEENFIRKNLLEKGGSVEDWKSKYKEYLALKEKEKIEKELKKRIRLERKGKKK